MVGVDTCKRTLSVVCTGGSGKARGYKVAPPEGLFLHHVTYMPGIDDPSTLLYPDTPHDEYGRLLDIPIGQGCNYSGEE